jgi:cellulose synthase/poly-beta-1,6-N-acetylglucosamine synthase-like glycosyltransferase
VTNVPPRLAPTIGGRLLAFDAALGLVAATYLAGLTVLGARRTRPCGDVGDPQTRFVVMVPAHNEAVTIAASMKSLRELRYPSELYGVHVVADNCSDETADIVRRTGWQVHERHDAEALGKGPALNWLFARLDASQEFDVAVVVDADTTVDGDLLRAFDLAFRGGADVAQAYYGVSDPGASASIGLRYAALASRHHVRALGRCRMGASCGLYGNGMAFRRSVLRRQPWTGHLVEDQEFQLELLATDGTTVRYVPTARVSAEMPDSLSAAASQNERWERGRIEMVMRYVPRLLRSTALGRPHSRRAGADAVADLLLPPLSVFAASRVAALAVNIPMMAVGRRAARRRVATNASILAVLGAHVLLGLWSVSAPTAVYRSLASAPSALAWKVRLWLRVIRRGSGVTWQRTTRNAVR